MNSILHNKNVLVTGGTGLVGSHVVEKLLAVGANVFVVDIVLKPKSYFSTQQFEKKTTLIMQDIRNLQQMKDLVKKHEIEYILHLAAQALVPEALLDPHLTLDTNIMGTVNILEAARASDKILGVVVASSDKAYGKNSFNVTEDQSLAGDHPYDVSKSATDLISTTYYQTYGLPVVVSRFGNIFGPGDLNFNRLVPGIMESVINNKVLELRSDGSFVRDYVYVKDVADGYVALTEQAHKVKGHAFNLSSGHNFSVIDLIKKFSEVLGKPVEYKIINNQQNEIPAQSLNWEKAQKVLGWAPKNTLEQGILETHNWYKQFFSNF
jgi:CDP-glucose 4,6-dehydratase